jgi:signal transduction histidine kinase
VQGVVDTIKPIADEKPVRVEFAFAEERAWSLLADGRRMRQVVLNVLTNAVKFTDAGGSIAVHLTSTAGHAQLVVCDTGRGIAPDVLPHVFERFRHGPGADAGHNGLGLGLTITRALVELHGGTIHIASAGEGLGTTCTIELPIGDDQDVSKRVPARFVRQS